MSPFIQGLFFILFTFSLHGQRHSFIQFSLNEGLPQSHVTAITEDSAGYLWVGTQGGGVTKFDGQHFVPVLAGDTDRPFAERYINALATDDARQVWIGTPNGLFMFDGNQFKKIDLSHHNDPVHAIEFFQDRIWVGTNQFVYQLTQTDTSFSIQKMTENSVGMVHGFYSNGQELWASTTTGAWMWSPTQQRISIQKGLSQNDVRCVHRGRDGLLWVFTFNGEIILFDQKLEQIVDSKKLPAVPHTVSSINQQIWVSTDKGVLVFDPITRQSKRIDERTGLAYSNIRRTYQDSWGNTWLLTRGGGLLKHLGEQFSHYNRQSGLVGEEVFAIAKKEDELWFSTSNKGVSVLKDGIIVNYGLDSGFLDVRCKAILADDDGRLWIGTEGQGLAIKDTSGFSFLTEKDGLPSNWIHQIETDSAGHIWVATYSNGVAKVTYRDSVGWTIYPYGTAQSLPSLAIQCLQKESDNRLWFSTQSGEIGYWVDDFTVRLFGASNGLPKVPITSMAFGAKNQVMVGTSGQGIFRADLSREPVTFHPISLSEKLRSKNINLLVFDDNGDLWAGHEKGLDLLIIGIFNQVSDVLFFGREAGFLGIETCKNAVLHGEEGSLWFGTMNGLTQYRPVSASKQAIPPKIHWNEVSIFYQSLRETPYFPTMEQTLRLPHHQNHVGFSFDAVALDDPGQIRYRWKLDGAEQDWSPFSERNYVNYSNLPPGRYEFFAKACKGIHPCSRTISMPFVIETPFWRTWWFRGGVVLLIGLVGFLLYRMRLKSIRQAEAGKRTTLEMQNKLLTIEQKALQLQMNPHFIFNALNSINALVVLKDHQNARRQINHFAALMRQVLTNSRKEKISLADEINTLTNYLKMEQFCRPDKFDYSIESSIEEALMDSVALPPMLLQPFVENAVIHGVSNLQDRKGHILIQFAQQQQFLHCTIRDNGIGRQMAQEQQKRKKTNHESLAMAVTQERIESISGQSIRITDEQVGTRVEFVLRLDNW